MSANSKLDAKIVRLEIHLSQSIFETYGFLLIISDLKATIS